MQWVSLLQLVRQFPLLQVKLEHPVEGEGVLEEREQEPEPLQARHGPPHAWLQHTPSQH